MGRKCLLSCRHFQAPSDIPAGPLCPRAQVGGLEVQDARRRRGKRKEEGKEGRKLCLSPASPPYLNRMTTGLPGCFAQMQ